MTLHYQDLRDENSNTVVLSHRTLRYKKSDEFVLSRRMPDVGAGKPFQIYNDLGKRVLDVSVVLLSLPFVLIVVGLLAVFVARRGGKPFYTQNRVGRGGRTYKMWKLRSMILDADDQLEHHLTQNSDARVEWDSTQKLKDDPRITRIGRFLRRSSMDELPQLWNVLRGDMSLVGPRPMMPCQTDLYPGTAYYGLRPGISGSWQVSARNTSSFAERATFDTDYDEKISFGEDLRILVATVRVVFRGTGY